MAIDDYLERRKNEKWKKTVTLTEHTWFKHLFRTIAVLILIAIFMTLVSACETIKYSAVDPSWTGRTQALIIANESKVQSRYNQQYVYTFQYFVDGKEYRGQEYQKRTATQSKYLKTVDIIYDEDNPQHFLVAPDDAKELYTKTSNIWLWIISFAIAICAHIAQQKSQERKEEKIKQAKKLRQAKKKNLESESNDPPNLLS